MVLILVFCVYADMSECLFVGDSRLMGWIPRRYAGWRIRLRVCPGRQLRELIRTATEALRPTTRLLVVIGLHCDLTYMTNYSAARPRGFMRLRTDPAVADICTVITTQDYAWRRSGALQVVWTLPYIPNFEIYNRRRAQTMNFASFCSLHVDEARWAAREIIHFIQVIDERLQSQGLCLVRLAPLVPELTRELGSDGLHLAPEMRQRVFGEVLRQAFSYLVYQAPIIRGRPLSVTQRWVRSERRRRQRRNRRGNTQHAQHSQVLRHIGSAVIRANVAP